MRRTERKKETERDQNADGVGLLPFVEPPTLISCKGVWDSWTRSWAWVDFPVPGVPVTTTMGERLKGERLGGRYEASVITDRLG